MGGEHLQSRAAAPGAVAALLQRQQQVLQLGGTFRRQTLQGQGGAAVVHGRIGRAPLQRQPLHLLGAPGRPDAVEHRQSAVGHAAAEQDLGVGEHHRQRLRCRMDRQQAFAQQAQPRVVTGLDQLAAQQIKPVEAARAQQLLEFRLADHRRRNRASRGGRDAGGLRRLGASRRWHQACRRRGADHRCGWRGQGARRRQQSADQAWDPK